MNYLHQHHDGPQILHNQKIHFELHLHSEVEIIALYKGSASLSVDGKSYRMGAGDFLIVFPESLHSYAAEADVDVGKFIFSPEIIPELAPSKNRRRVSPFSRKTVRRRKRSQTCPEKFWRNSSTVPPSCKKPICSC